MTTHVYDDLSAMLHLIVDHYESTAPHQGVEEEDAALCAIVRAVADVWRAEWQDEERMHRSMPRLLVAVVEQMQNEIVASQRAYDQLARMVP